MTTLDTLLAEIRARLDRATEVEILRELLKEQEIHYSEMRLLAAVGSRLHADESLMTEGVCKGIEYAIESLQNSPAIAHAPTDIARLLKVIERLREQRNDWIRGWYYMRDPGGLTDSLKEHDAELAAILKGKRAR